MKKFFLILSAGLFLISQSLFADQSSFKFHTDKGCEYLRINAYDEAIAEFEKALKQDPENSEAHSNLALARLMKHIEMFNYGLPIEMVESISKNGKVDLKECERLKKEWNDSANELEVLANEGFKKAIELDDKNWHAHYFVGTHYYNTGDFKAAEVELKKAIEFNSDYTNSYGVLASLYEKMGKMDLAIEYRNKDLELDPDDDGARRDLALLYHKLGMKEEALKEYKILKKENSVLVPSLKPIFVPAR